MHGLMYGLEIFLAIMDVMHVFLGVFIPLVQRKIGRNPFYGFKDI